TAGGTATIPPTLAAVPVPLGAPTPVTVTRLAVTTTAPAAATAGVAYRVELAASGGVPPYRWAVAAGTLPSGLALSPAGVLSGVPGTPGRTSLTVVVTDSSSPVRQRAAALLTVQVNAPPFAGQASSNWSGYVVASPGPLLTEASGQWTVPALTCAAASEAGLATWVGIGGARTGTSGSSGMLLQTGVSSDCAAGAQVETAWWEEFPSEPNGEVAFTGLQVTPGDVLRGTIYQTTGGAWVTRLDDLTTGLSGVMVTGVGWGISVDGSGTFSSEGSTAGLSYAGGTSAEWIAEDYEQAGALVPLADFGTVGFSSLTTSLPSWSLSGADAVEIVQGGNVLALPSAPGPDGFTITAAAPTAAAVSTG
ncbi:MAG: G1 family endopeptidase, partial [Actinomycetota bacterium]|nr:G1 family endopeptidase [Actinomycetota bacterium]